jgi:hypothetical protein
MIFCFCDEIEIAAINLGRGIEGTGTAAGGAVRNIERRM